MPRLMWIRQRQIKVSEKLKDTFVYLNQGDISAQANPSSIPKDHIAGFHHPCQTRFLSSVALVDEPSLWPEDVGVFAVERAVVAMHTPGCIPDHGVAGYVVFLLLYGHNISLFWRDSGEEIDHWRVYLE